MKRFFLLNLLTLLLGACMSANGVQLEGKIKYIGATPHNFLALEDRDHKIYKISNPEDFNIAQKQNHSVVIKAKILKKTIGVGFPTLIKVTDLEVP